VSSDETLVVSSKHNVVDLQHYSSKPKPVAASSEKFLRLSSGLMLVSKTP
jgi:hypothetical protein